MTGIIYTYPPDYAMAAMGARALIAAGVRPVLAIDRADPCLVVEGADIVRTDFDRQGNLNGRDFILGNLRLMEELATGDYTLKVDSDTLVLNLGMLGERTACAAGIWTGQLQGCAYALRVADIAAMRRRAERVLKPGVRYMEDQVTGYLAVQRGPVHFPQPSPGFFGGYVLWREARTPAWCAENAISVLNFPLRQGMERRAILHAMDAFV